MGNDILKFVLLLPHFSENRNSNPTQLKCRKMSSIPCLSTPLRNDRGGIEAYFLSLSFPCPSLEIPRDGGGKFLKESWFHFYTQSDIQKQEPCGVKYNKQNNSTMQ